MLIELFASRETEKIKKFKFLKLSNSTNKCEI